MVTLLKCFGVANSPSKDLLKFIKPFPEDVQETVLWLRDFVWKLYPEANELIYDNYNAVAFGWSLTDKQQHCFCTIAVFRTNYNIHFGFYYGNLLNDTEKMLLGKGNQYRYLLIKNKKDLPKTYIKKLLNEAYINSLNKVKDKSQLKEGLIITKSISAVKRSKKKAGLN